MEIRDWVTIVSVTAIVIGWFINSWLNRRNEIAKERLKYRMDTLKSIVILKSQIVEALRLASNDLSYNSSHLGKLTYDTVDLINIYGENDEIELCEKFILALNNRDYIASEEILNKFIQVARVKIRKELKLLR
jgi:hypothetical protein